MIVPDDLATYRSAMLLIDQHGRHASLEATNRADELLDLGDLAGQGTWLAIRDAVRELQRARPGYGDVAH